MTRRRGIFSSWSLHKKWQDRLFCPVSFSFRSFSKHGVITSSSDFHVGSRTPCKKRRPFSGDPKSALKGHRSLTQKRWKYSSQRPPVSCQIPEAFALNANKKLYIQKSTGIANTQAEGEIYHIQEVLETFERHAPQWLGVNAAINLTAQQLQLSLHPY